MTLFDSIISVIIKAVDDCSNENCFFLMDLNTVACSCCRIFTLCGNKLNTDEVLHKIYMELLKRMDDADDEIRMIVVKSWNAYFDVSKE